MFFHILQSYSPLDFLLLFVAAVLMPAMSARAGAQLAKPDAQARPLIGRYWRMVARGWIVVALIATVWLLLGRPWLTLGLVMRFGRWEMFGLGLVGVIAAAIVVQFLRLGSMSPERLKTALSSFDRMRVVPTTRGELFVFVLVAVTAGVWEELVYRGFLIGFLGPLAGLAGATVLSSFIFGLGHAYQGAPGVVVTSLVGLLLGIGYILSGNLWWLMAVHALIDIYGGVVAYRVRQLAAQQGVT